MKLKQLLTICMLLVLSMTACSTNFGDAEDVGGLTSTDISAEDVSNVDSQEQEAAAVTEDVNWPNFNEEDLDDSLDSIEMTTITLSGTKITAQGDGVTITDNILTITSAGTYQISGSLSEGQIIVDTKDEDTVHLIFDGMDITSSTSEPIFVKNAENTVITLVEGTDNVVLDGTMTLDEGEEPNAAIFSNDDLTINGTGSLMVNGNRAHGIASDDGLKIVSGTITVIALRDGIQGRDSIAVQGGVITITAGSDGMHANNDVDEDEGNIFIEGGIFKITAEKDGIQAENILAISGGEFIITTGGGSASVSRTDLVQWDDWDYQNTSEDSDVSAKGLKADLQLLITGGVFTLASGDDGAHADAVLEINGGSLEITQSYEGIESAAITINDGTIHLAAMDDGINGSSGNGGEMMGGGREGGQFGSGDCALVINGGLVALDAEGDGIDINGTIEMTDGLLIVNGPTGNRNGAFDYLGSFNISGGFFVAVGSSDMAQAPSSSSNQHAFLYNFDAVQGPGTLLHVESSTGEEILTFVPSKAYQSVVVSSLDFEEGEIYVIYAGGSAEGAVVDGLYSEGSYAPGTQVDSFTFSEMVMSLGSAVGGRGDFMEGEDGVEPGGGVPGGGRHP